MVGFRGRWPGAAWAPDTSAIYYRDGAKMMRVPAVTEPAFKPGNTELLWERDYPHSGESLWRGRVYDIHPDGDRFLFVSGGGGGGFGEVYIVTNWFEELRQRMGSN